MSFASKELTKGKVYYNHGLMEFSFEEAPGLSVFAKDANGMVHRTYITYGRGPNLLIGTDQILDLVPKGRDEAGLEHAMS
ncbi:MAG: DUF899 family protein [Undibacterium sp.]|nr:DUF899 family protein [Opitutaceae bacterium]